MCFPLLPKSTRQSLGSLSPMAALSLNSLRSKSGSSTSVAKGRVHSLASTVSKQKREPENRFLPSSTDISKGMAILREAEKGNALNFELYWPQGQRHAVIWALSACYGMQSAFLTNREISIFQLVSKAIFLLVFHRYFIRLVSCCPC